jgi:hypothetical protein
MLPQRPGLTASPPVSYILKWRGSGPFPSFKSFAVTCRHCSAAKPLSQDFSNRLLFFPTGKAVQARLAEQGCARVPMIEAAAQIVRALPAE